MKIYDKRKKEEFSERIFSKWQSEQVWYGIDFYLKIKFWSIFYLINRSVNISRLQKFDSKFNKIDNLSNFRENEHMFSYKMGTNFI